MRGVLAGIENKVCLGRQRHRLAHDAISKVVSDEGYVNKTLPRGYAGEVADPEQVRCRRPQHSVHIVARTGR